MTVKEGFLILKKIYNRLALNALTTGDYITAEKYFKKILTKGNSREGINYNYAIALMGMKKYNEAEEHLHREMEISGEKYNTLRTISELYYNSGQREKAQKFLKQVLEKCADVNESAIIKNKIKNSSDEKTYKKCIEALTYFESGVALLHSGDWEKARNAFIQALNLDKTNPFIYNNLGYICMMKEKKYFEARDLFKKAIKLSNLPLIKENLLKAERLISDAGKTKA